MGRIETCLNDLRLARGKTFRQYSPRRLLFATIFIEPLGGAGWKIFGVYIRRINFRVLKRYITQYSVRKKDHYTNREVANSFMYRMFLRINKKNRTLLGLRRFGDDGNQI